MQAASHCHQTCSLRVLNKQIFAGRRLKQAMVRDQEDEEEKVRWRVDAEVRLRTTALQAAADASAQQGGQQAVGLQVGAQLLS